MSTTTHQLGALEQAAILGRGCAIDIFVRTLHPKARSKDFKWQSLVQTAGIEASQAVLFLVRQQTWDGLQKAIIETASNEAQIQMQEMLEMSGVRKWLKNDK